MPIIHSSNLNQLTKITQVPTINTNNINNAHNNGSEKIYFNLSGPIQLNDFYDKPRDSDTQTLINRSFNLFPKLMENTKIVDFNIEFIHLNSYNHLNNLNNNNNNNNFFSSIASSHASNASSSSIASLNNGLDSSITSSSSSSSSSLYNTGYVSVSYLNLNYSNTYHYNNPKRTKIINCLNYGLNEIYSISGILTQIELLLYNSNRESRL
ncbi:hypothetical protein B5S33_g3775 [[Candida] boidinii]|nr:hypothetical protein B5S27_g5628 [[Candida] boidinii]OWB68068.1 hypothetical protein B5S30_g3439 [[Candida] boidinii]OWB85117.1 hypothetical protein B5S33_g3775 [[Candida] boidinii]